MLSPLSNVGHAYSLLMQDEKQREVYVNSQFLGESSSFIGEVYVNSQFPGESSSFIAANQNHTCLKFGNSDFKGKKNILVCSYCKQPSHSVDKYYRIISFPDDFKFTKPRNIQGMLRAMQHTQ